MSSAEAKPGSFVREVEIVSSRGLHARASAKFVQMAEKFDAEIRVSREGQTVPGTSIMGLMMLAAGKGTELELETEGADAEAALEAVAALIADRFGEDA